MSNLNLPLDMIAEILFRLPPKNLLCCRCVSKPWRALIDSRNFINLHLNYSLHIRSNFNIILKNSELYSVPLDFLNSPKLLDHPLMCYNHSIKVLGSYNGLLCICNVVDDMALWNPSIKLHHVLPYLSIELKRYFGICSCRVCVFGFGYDVVNDDYKVVRIAQFGVVSKRSFESEVKVYSFRRNSWRRITDMPYFVVYPGANGVFAGGALHWLVSRNPESNEANTIVGLDLGLECYNEVKQPEISGVNYTVAIGVLEGCLCFLANFQGKCADLWVMKEYGTKRPWTKMFSIVQQEVSGVIRSIKPLAYSKSGNEVLLEHDNVNLFWYDLMRKEVKNVWIRGMPVTFEAEIYVESLMLLDSNRMFYERARYQREEASDTNWRNDFLSEGFKLSL